MAASTITAAAREMLAIDASLAELDRFGRLMATVYADRVSAADWLEFHTVYVHRSVHRWFTEQWLYLAGEAANESTQGDQPCFEHGREGMEPEACASATGRGENVAPARATLPHYESPGGGPMGAGYPAAAGPTAGVTPDAARHPHADGTHRPPDPTGSQHPESSVT